MFKPRCQACGGLGTFYARADEPPMIIEDGTIIWAVCDHCGKDIAVDCIVNNGIKEG